MDKTRLALALLLLPAFSVNTFTQQPKPIPTCSQAAFAAYKPFPKLEYECDESLAEYDDKVLKLPQRLAAIRGVMKQLEGFTNEAWWRASVDELNACNLHQGAGRLNDEEKQRWRSGDYNFDLEGNREMRLVLIDDPCFQTGYQGSNGFLLYHKDGNVFVSQLLNGYYSRVDNSVAIDFARLNGEQIIEVSTANSMPPSMVYYYFFVDPKTNRALPKKLFKDGKKLTNEIYSDMLMGEPKDFGLPRDAGELNIIRKGRLASSFSAYEMNEHGVDAYGKRLNRVVYRWNGRFYVRRQRKVAFVAK
jgi:hypothetical protein